MKKKKMKKKKNEIRRIVPIYWNYGILYQNHERPDKVVLKPL